MFDQRGQTVGKQINIWSDKRWGEFLEAVRIVLSFKLSEATGLAWDVTLYWDLMDAQFTARQGEFSHRTRSMEIGGKNEWPNEYIENTVAEILYRYGSAQQTQPQR